MNNLIYFMIYSMTCNNMTDKKSNENIFKNIVFSMEKYIQDLVNQKGLKIKKITGSMMLKYRYVLEYCKGCKWPEISHRNGLQELSV